MKLILKILGSNKSSTTASIRLSKYYLINNSTSSNRTRFYSSSSQQSSTTSSTADNKTTANENATASSSSIRANDYFDVVVCGGGMVGTAMAYALSREELFKNLRIALIESSGAKGAYKCSPIHNNRVCALGEKTINFFKDLGTFDFIKANRYGEVKFMQVWDGCSDASISFRGENDNNLALIVENDLIQASLSQHLAKEDNLKVVYSNQIKAFKQNDEDVEIKLNDNIDIRTKLLIGSDGVNSFIRQKANFDVTKWDYEQTAIVATLKLDEKTTNHTAWQRFLSTGPIALLPLNEEYSSLVWSIKRQFAKELLNISEDEFVHKVNNAFIQENEKDNLANKVESQVQNGLDLLRNLIPQLNEQISERNSVISILPPRVGSCAPNSRASFPLSFMHSNNYVSNRIALIGDAVHRVHPLAGQGVNLGFGDVICLIDSLKEAVRNGADIGSSIYLKKYESNRQREAYPKIIGIDMLNRLYTHNNYPSLTHTPLIALRSAGLAVSNRLNPLKKLFVDKAMN